MKTEIIINVGSHESRIAILEEGKLVEILAEFAENERMVGNIYKGTTAAVLPGMQAAFVDIGHDKSAFLHISDMPGSPGSMVDLDEETLEEVDIRTSSRGRTMVPIEELVQKGQDILVQVKKEPIGTKGPRVSAVPSLAGRFMVLVPNGEKIGVSRKITNWAEKRRLKDITRDLKPDGYGIIVRTEALGKGDRELGRGPEAVVGNLVANPEAGPKNRRAVPDPQRDGHDHQPHPGSLYQRCGPAGRGLQTGVQADPQLPQNHISTPARSGGILQRQSPPSSTPSALRTKLKNVPTEKSGSREAAT